MYLALSVQYGRDDQLVFAPQLGVESVVVEVEDWSRETLEQMRNRVEKSGLQLAGVEGLGLEDVARAIRAVHQAGAAGIDLVGCGMVHIGERKPDGRGGALVGERQAGPGPSPEPLRQIAAAAEEVGVRLALRSGVPIEGLGIDLDLGALAGADPAGIIRRCGDRILMVWAANVLDGREAFLNEGEVHLPATLLALKEVGFTGPVRAAPPPGIVGDTPWGHTGRALELGYLRAVLQTVGE